MAKTKNPNDISLFIVDMRMRSALDAFNRYGRIIDLITNGHSADAATEALAAMLDEENIFASKVDKDDTTVAHAYAGRKHNIEQYRRKYGAGIHN